MKKLIHTVSLLITPLLFFPLPTQALNKQQNAYENIHRTLYFHPLSQQATRIQLYSKQANAAVFFGLSCRDNTPFPTLELILMNENILFETPKLLEVTLHYPNDTHTLNGILTYQNEADNLSNQIRFEAKPDQSRSFTSLQNQYKKLVEHLLKEEKIDIRLKHNNGLKKAYLFELKGLKTQLSEHKSLCH